MATVTAKAPARARTPTPQRTPSKQSLPQVCCDAIAKRAYEKFLARGGEHGFDQLDWFEAEKELVIEAAEATQ
jgi:hypothetical protein